MRIRPFHCAFVLACVAPSCGSTDARPIASRPAPAPAASAPRSAPPLVSTPATNDSVTCRAVPTDVPVLDSLWTIADGRRYYLDVVYRGTEWAPAQTLPMPHHHASRLEWVGLEAFPELARAATEPGATMRFELTVLGRTIVHDQREERLWFATYRARVDSVCRVR